MTWVLLGQPGALIGVFVDSGLMHDSGIWEVHAPSYAMGTGTTKNVDGDGGSGVEDRVIYACAMSSYFTAPQTYIAFLWGCPDTVTKRISLITP